MGCFSVCLSCLSLVSLWHIKLENVLLSVTVCSLVRLYADENQNERESQRERVIRVLFVSLYFVELLSIFDGFVVFFGGICETSIRRSMDFSAVYRFVFFVLCVSRSLCNREL